MSKFIRYMQVRVNPSVGYIGRNNPAKSARIRQTQRLTPGMVKTFTETKLAPIPATTPTPAPPPVPTLKPYTPPPPIQEFYQPTPQYIPTPTPTPAPRMQTLPPEDQGLIQQGEQAQQRSERLEKIATGVTIFGGAIAGILGLRSIFKKR